MAYEFSIAQTWSFRIRVFQIWLFFFNSSVVQGYSNSYSWPGKRKYLGSWLEFWKHSETELFFLICGSPVFFEWFYNFFWCPTIWAFFSKSEMSKTKLEFLHFELFSSQMHFKRVSPYFAILWWHFIGVFIIQKILRTIIDNSLLFYQYTEFTFIQLFAIKFLMPPPPPPPRSIETSKEKQISRENGSLVKFAQSMHLNESACYII